MINYKTTIIILLLSLYTGNSTMQAEKGFKENFRTQETQFFIQNNTSKPIDLCSTSITVNPGRTAKGAKDLRCIAIIQPNKKEKHTLTYHLGQPQMIIVHQDTCYYFNLSGIIEKNTTLVFKEDHTLNGRKAILVESFKKFHDPFEL